MELDASGGSTIITDDYVEGWLNVLITAAPSTQAATEGYDVELRESDNSDMTTGAAVLASVHIKNAGIAAGKKYSIKVSTPLTMKFLSAWHKATSTGFTTGVTVDTWMSSGPVGENEDIQKVPSRS
jgi:uncharacterized protein (DUF2126 family)